MQGLKPVLAPIAAVAAGALALGGCATKDYVLRHVSTVDAKVQSTQTEVNAQGQKIGDLDRRAGEIDKTAHEALERASAAGKLAEGKFLYSMVLSDDSVKFPPDSSKLSAEAQTRLMDFVQKLKSENKNVYLEIQGHTDSTGSEKVNHRLGQDRAEAVRLFMNKQGVALNRMSTISYGAQAPVAPNNTREGRAQNRRVVVVVLI